MRKKRVKIQVGDKFNTFQCGEVEVVEILPERRYKVRFVDGYCGVFHHSGLRSGRIKNPYQKVHYGVGFVGESAGTQVLKTKAYRVWHMMLMRCYAEDKLEKFPSYEGCYVAPIWHNFHEFKMWYEAQPNWQDSGFEIDKDILVKGNRQYGPEFCHLIPAALNKLIENRSRSKKREPIGVHYKEDIEKYMVSCSDHNGKNQYLGVYVTVDEAFQAYKAFKEAVIRQSAEKYKQQISQRAYESLLKYEVEVTG